MSDFFYSPFLGFGCGLAGLQGSDALSAKNQTDRPDDDYNLDETTENGEMEMNFKERIESGESFRLARDNLVSEGGYSHIVCLKFYNQSKCLLTMFDSATDCHEFIQLLNLLKALRG